jgi:hypothetical protein
MTSFNEKSIRLFNEKSISHYKLSVGSLSVMLQVLLTPFEAHLSSYIVQNVAYMFEWVSRDFFVSTYNFGGSSTKCPNQPQRAT